MNFFLSEGRINFLTWTTKVLAPHTSQSFKHSVAVSTKAINTACTNFFLCTHCIETFHFTLWSDSLKERHVHVSKSPHPVLTQFKFARFRICFASSVQTSWHRLTDREGIKLTSMNSDRTFAQACRLPIKSLVHKSFRCKNNGWSNNHVFTNIPH